MSPFVIAKDFKLPTFNALMILFLSFLMCAMKESSFIKNYSEEYDLITFILLLYKYTSAFLYICWVFLCKSVLFE